MRQQTLQAAKAGWGENLIYREKYTPFQLKKARCKSIFAQLANFVF